MIPEGRPMVATVRQYKVTNEEWAKIEPYIAEAKGNSRGRPPEDSRKMLNGICWIIRSGAALTDMIPGKLCISAS